MTNPLDDVLKALETLLGDVKYPATKAWIGGVELNHLLDTDIYDPHKTYFVTPDKIEEIV